MMTPININEVLLREIEAKGYTVETFTNHKGNRFTFVIWKEGKQLTDLEPGTWFDIEPMLRWIIVHKIPELEKEIQRWISLRWIRQIIVQCTYVKEGTIIHT